MHPHPNPHPPKPRARRCARLPLLLTALTLSLLYTIYAASTAPVPRGAAPRGPTARERFCAAGATRPWRMFPSLPALGGLEVALTQRKTGAIGAHLSSGARVGDWVGLGRGGVTVVLAYESNAALCKQVDALLAQSVAPAAIWVVARKRDAAFSARQVRKVFRERRVQSLRVAQGSAVRAMFQMALQVRTRFVMLVDSRVRIGPRCVEMLRRLAAGAPAPSAFGLAGAVLQPVGRSGAAGRGAWVVAEEGERVVEADALAGLWFIEAAWAKVFFREPLESVALFSLALRKHARVASYVVPASEELGSVEKTAVAPYMASSSWRLAVVNSGRMVLGQQQDVAPPSCAVVVDGPRQAHLLYPLLKAWLADAEHRIVLVVTGQCQRVMDEMLLPQVSCDGVLDTAHVYDLNLPERGTQHEVHLAAVLEAIRPATVLSLDVGGERSDWLAEEIAAASVKAEATNIRLPASQVSLAKWMVDLDPKALRQWHVPTIVVSVITMNRPESLRRLLRSLNESHYLGDSVKLVINVDQKTDRETLEVTREFEWKNGLKDVRVRVASGGLAESVAGSWYPADENEYGALFEDDVEASPYWYIWAKYSILKYMYSSRPAPASLVGISLYSPRLVEVVYPRKRWDSNKALQHVGLYSPYLYQLPCSWGAVFFPRHWVVFRRYLEMRLASETKNVKVVPGSRSTGWKSSWKKFMIDELYLRGFFFLYPNYFNQTSFTTNHLEIGEHIGQPGASLDHHPQDFTVPLMEKPDMFYTLPKGVLPPYEDLPMMDVFNNIIDESTAVLAGSEAKLDSVRCSPAQRPVVDADWRLACADLHLPEETT